MKSEKPAAQPAPAESSEQDVALIHGVGSDGSVHVLRKRGDRLEAGALKPVAEGKPITGELVTLRPRESCPLLCDVDVHYTPPAATSAKPVNTARAARRKGPAQVATDVYRDNWDSIWNSKKSDALN